MKTEWRFDFEAVDFKFDKEHKYKAQYSETVTFGEETYENLEFFVCIKPDEEKKPPPRIEQVGTLFITLPASPIQTKSFAYHIARQLQERISFQSGEFNLKGMPVGKILTETPEEEKECGDRLYYMDVHLQVVDQTPKFDSKTLVNTPINPKDNLLVSQFNESKCDKSLIRQFHGYFKILESLASTSGSAKYLKDKLKSCTLLREVFTQHYPDLNYDDHVDILVPIRHKCAHLKVEINFGYTPNDPKVTKEVKPYITMVATLAYFAIEKSSFNNKIII